MEQNAFSPLWGNVHNYNNDAIAFTSEFHFEIFQNFQMYHVQMLMQFYNKNHTHKCLTH